MLHVYSTVNWNGHSYSTMNLKIVFLPLLAFEVIILIDNIRALMPGDEESMSDEAIWETLPLNDTRDLVLKKILAYQIFIAECFAFLVCTRWFNPVIHRHSRLSEPASSSTTIRYLDWNSGLVVSSEEDQNQGRMCGLEDIGGHIMKIPVVAFQVLLCMRLEGTPPAARHIPIAALFSPLFLLQGAGVLFAAARLVEKIVLLLRSGASTGRYFTISSRVRDCFGFLHHGSRLLGWWSIDEGSKEEQARLFHASSAGYNTFCGYPPEVVKKMPKKDLAEEVLFGDYKQLLENKLKSQNTPSRSTKDFKMKRSYVESALRGRYAWCCFHVGIVFCAATAPGSVSDAPFAESRLRSASSQMLARFVFLMNLNGNIPQFPLFVKVYKSFMQKELSPSQFSLMTLKAADAP
ncbi:hypothetical protein ACLOJK_025231 [Asimina triloba]